MYISVYRNNLDEMYLLLILHKFVLIQLIKKCVNTTQFCVHMNNTRMCVLSRHKCFQSIHCKSKNVESLLKSVGQYETIYKYFENFRNILNICPNLLDIVRNSSTTYEFSRVLDNLLARSIGHWGQMRLILIYGEFPRLKLLLLTKPNIHPCLSGFKDSIGIKS